MRKRKRKEEEKRKKISKIPTVKYALCYVTSVRLLFE